MANTHVFKSGNTVTTENGITTITKVRNGKTITKKYNMNNLCAGTLVGDGGNVKVGKGVVHVENEPPSEMPNYATPPGRAGVGVPVGGIAGNANNRAAMNAPPIHPVHYAPPPPHPNPAPIRVHHNPAPRHVQNQFNITGSKIGQVAIGNRGTTVFNNQTKEYNAGAHHSDIKIQGGDFKQANIGGDATYNNKDTVLGDGGGMPGKGLTVDDLFDSDMVAEEQVLTILRKGMTAKNFVEVLRTGITLEQICAALEKQPKVTDAMLRSMLQYDGKDSDDDITD